MTEDSDPGASSTVLSSLPDHPITDTIVKQIGESDHPKIHGAMGFPGSTSGTIEAFMLHIEGKTHVLVFDPNAEGWRVYESFDTTDMSHQEMVDHASDLANDWFSESLTDRIAAVEESDSET